MKKLRFFLPVVAFLFAVAAAFAGNVISRDVVLTEPLETTNCEPCTDNLRDDCDTVGDDPCECTFLGGPVAGANDSCVPLFED